MQWQVESTHLIFIHLMKKPGQVQLMNGGSAATTVSLHRAMLIGKETDLL